MDPDDSYDDEDDESFGGHPSDKEESGDGSEDGEDEMDDEIDDDNIDMDEINHLKGNKVVDKKERRKK